MRLKGFIKELKKRKVGTHRADVNIGKNGIHRGLINEIKRILETQGCVKVRILRSSRRNISEEDVIKLAKETDSVIVDSRGYTYVLIARRILKSSSDRVGSKD